MQCVVTNAPPQNRLGLLDERGKTICREDYLEPEDDTIDAQKDDT